MLADMYQQFYYTFFESYVYQGNIQKQPSRGVLKKRCSEKQSNFIEITLRHGCSPVNLLHILRTSFLMNTYGQQLLNILAPKIF